MTRGRRRIIILLTPVGIGAAWIGISYYLSTLPRIPQWQSATIELAPFRGTGTHVSADGKHVAASNGLRCPVLSHAPGVWTPVAGLGKGVIAWTRYFGTDGTAYGSSHNSRNSKDNSAFEVPASDKAARLIRTTSPSIFDSSEDGSVQLVRDSRKMRYAIRTANTLTDLQAPPGFAAALGHSMSSDGSTVLALLIKTRRLAGGVWRNGIMKVYDQGAESFPMAISNSGESFVMSHDNSLHLYVGDQERVVFRPLRPEPSLGERISQFWSRLSGAGKSAVINTGKQTLYSRANVSCIFNNGKVLMGYRKDRLKTESEAAIWTERSGWFSVESELKRMKAHLPHGWKLVEVNDVSRDMMTLVGTASRGLERRPVVIRFLSQ